MIVLLATGLLFKHADIKIINTPKQSNKQSKYRSRISTTYLRTVQSIPTLIALKQHCINKTYHEVNTTPIATLPC